MNSAPEFPDISIQNLVENISINIGDFQKNKQQTIYSNQILIKSIECQIHSTSIQMNQIINLLISTQKTINQKIESLVDNIRKQIQYQANLLESIKIENQIIQDNYVKYSRENQKNFQKVAIQEIEIIKEMCRFDDLIIFFQEMDQINIKNGQFQDIDYNMYQNKNQKMGSFVFQKLPTKSDIFTIVSNKDASIIIAGYSDSIIKVFEFKKEQLKVIQEVQCNEDERSITCLEFMNKCNQFLSGSEDWTIKIWQQSDNDGLWINYETLIGHEDQINYLIINSNEDMIISADECGQIIIWKFNNDKWQLAQQIACLNRVYQMSLNDSNTQLIYIRNQQYLQFKTLFCFIFKYSNIYLKCYKEYLYNHIARQNQQITYFNRNQASCTAFIKFSFIFSNKYFNIILQQQHNKIKKIWKNFLCF